MTELGRVADEVAAALSGLGLCTEMSELILAIYRRFRHTSKAGALPTVLWALAMCCPKHEVGLMSAASTLQKCALDGQTPDRKLARIWRPERPYVREAPVALFCYRLMGRAIEGCQPADSRLLAERGEFYIRTLIKIDAEKDERATQGAAYLLNRVLAESTRLNSLEDLTDFHQNEFKAPSTFDQRAADVELLAGYLGFDPALHLPRRGASERGAHGRGTARSSAGKASSALRHESEPAVRPSVDEQDKNDALRRQLAAALPAVGLGDRGRKQEKRKPIPKWDSARPEYPTPFHIALSLAALDVAVHGGVLVGPAADRALASALLRAVFLWDDQAVLAAAHFGEADPPPGALSVLDQGRSYLLRGLTVGRNLGIWPMRGRGEPAWTVPCDEPTSPHPAVSCWALQPLRRWELELVADTLNRARPDASELPCPLLAGTRLTYSRLRMAGAGMARDAGLEACEVALLGGPAETGLDAQLAYERFSALELAQRSLAVRKSVAGRLLRSLKEETEAELRARHHFLAEIAVGCAEWEDPFAEDLALGSRRVPAQAAVQELIRLAARALEESAGGPARRDALLVALAVDLIANYGVRVQSIPEFDRRQANATCGRIGIPGKRVNGEVVTGDMELASESQRLLTDALAASSRSRGLLFRLGNGQLLDANVLERFLARVKGSRLQLGRLARTRHAFNVRLRELGVAEHARKAILLHSDPLSGPHQKWASRNVKSSVPVLSVEQVRFPFGYR